MPEPMAILQQRTEEARQHLADARNAGAEGDFAQAQAHALCGLLALAVGMAEQVIEQEREPS